MNIKVEKMIIVEKYGPYMYSYYGMKFSLEVLNDIFLYFLINIYML